MESNLPSRRVTEQLGFKILYFRYRRLPEKVGGGERGEVKYVLQNPGT